MKREIRYVVVKIKDAQNHLSQADLDRLQNLAMSVNAGRLAEGKHPMECVVVESDWPEYERVWQMIADRVDSMTAQTEDLDEPQPEWAVGRLNGEYMTKGASLATRDGRRIGNAFVCELTKHPTLGMIATVITDMGNKVSLTESELKELFFPPVWIMNCEEALRARSSHRQHMAHSRINRILIITDDTLHPPRVDDRGCSFIRMTINQWKADPHKFECMELDAVIFLAPPPDGMEQTLRFQLAVRNGGILHEYKP